MKRFLMVLLISLLLFPAASLAADRNLPEEILSVFKTPTWKGYAIPVTSAGNPYSGLAASYYYDEHGHASAIAILKKDAVNALCVLEKNNGVWFVAAQSTTAILQGDEIPFLSCEVYGTFDISYPRSDGQPYLDITVQQSDAQWTVSEIRYFPDDVYLYVQIDADELRYTGDATGWEPVIVTGHMENSLSLFSLADFPLSIEAAQALFSESPGE